MRNSAFLLVSLFLIVCIGSSSVAQVSLLQNKSSKSTGVTSLMSAVAEVDIEGIHFFIKSQPEELNKKNLGGATALHIASRMKNAQIVKILLDNGASVNEIDAEGWTPLMRASLAGSSEVVELLLSKKAQVVMLNSFGESAIMHAASSGCNACLKTMFEHTDFKKDGDKKIATKQINDAFIIAKNHDNQEGQEILGVGLDKVLNKNEKKAAIARKEEIPQAEKKIEEPKVVKNEEKVVTKVADKKEVLPQEDVGASINVPIKITKDNVKKALLPDNDDPFDISVETIELADQDIEGFPIEAIVVEKAVENEFETLPNQDVEDTAVVEAVPEVEAKPAPKKFSFFGLFRKEEKDEELVDTAQIEPEEEVEEITPEEFAEESLPMQIVEAETLEESDLEEPVKETAPKLEEKIIEVPSQYVPIKEPKQVEVATVEPVAIPESRAKREAKKKFKFKRGPSVFRPEPTVPAPPSFDVNTADGAQEEELREPSIWSRITGWFSRSDKASEPEHEKEIEEESEEATAIEEKPHHRTFHFNKGPKAKVVEPVEEVADEEEKTSGFFNFFKNDKEKKTPDVEKEAIAVPVQRPKTKKFSFHKGPEATVKEVEKETPVADTEEIVEEKVEEAPKVKSSGFFFNFFSKNDDEEDTLDQGLEELEEEEAEHHHHEYEESEMPLEENIGDAEIIPEEEEDEVIGAEPKKSSGFFGFFSRSNEDEEFIEEDVYIDETETIAQIAETQEFEENNDNEYEIEALEEEVVEELEEEVVEDQESGSGFFGFLNIFSSKEEFSIVESSDLENADTVEEKAKKFKFITKKAYVEAPKKEKVKPALHKAPLKAKAIKNKKFKLSVGQKGAYDSKEIKPIETKKEKSGFFDFLFKKKEAEVVKPEAAHKKFKLSVGK